MKLLLAILALAFLVVLIATCYRQNALVFSVLGIATVTIFLCFPRRGPHVIPFAVGAILGPLMEMILIRFGAWQYAIPVSLGSLRGSPCYGV